MATTKKYLLTLYLVFIAGMSEEQLIVPFWVGQGIHNKMFWSLGCQVMWPTIFILIYIWCSVRAFVFQ